MVPKTNLVRELGKAHDVTLQNIAHMACMVNIPRPFLMSLPDVYSLENLLFLEAVKPPGLHCYWQLHGAVIGLPATSPSEIHNAES